MNYKETTEYLFNQLPFFQKVGASAYKPGLERSLALDSLFHSPHKSYKTIHVGGTNGKGSTSHTLSAILQQAGYKVGLYTSPHLVDFRERIRVDGKMMEESFVVDFVQKYKEDFEPLQCSFFELTMMMAFYYFREQQVDVAVIEVGLGGRLDSTNIISPDLSIITNVSLDHTQFLGDTVEEIAVEKAGIIKAGIPVVIGSAKGEVKNIFENTASRVNATIRFADSENVINSLKRENGKWLFDTVHHGEIIAELGGYAQIENAKTILLATDILKDKGYNITDEAIQVGFSQVVELTGLQGRWQQIQDVPKVICDTGHNLAGVEYIVEQLKNEEYKELHIIWGMANDKDITHIMEILPKNAYYYFVKAQIDRAMPTEVLLSIAQNYNLKGDAFPSIKDAYAIALKNASEDDMIFIGGSNFVVGEFLASL